MLSWLGKGVESSMVGLDRVMVGFTHFEEPLLHTILNKPYGSSVLVGHYHRSLYLNQLSGMVEVYNNNTRSTIEKETEFQKNSFLNSCLVFAWSLGRAGQVDSRYIKGGSLGQSCEGRFGYLLIEAWAASDIDIFPTLGDFEGNIRDRSL